MNIQYRHKTTLLLFIFSLSFLNIGLLWSDNAEAHKGHAGKKITFLKKKEVLKALLPTSGKVYRRKQRLDSDQSEWVKNQFNVDIKSRIYSFYVSKNKQTKSIIGSAIIHKFAYRHGFVELAVGLNEDKKVKATAFVSVNDKYLVDFEETVGTGFLKTYTNMSVNDLIENANKLIAADKATREFANAIRDAVLILIAFQQ